MNNTKSHRKSISTFAWVLIAWTVLIFGIGWISANHRTAPQIAQLEHNLADAQNQPPVVIKSATPPPTYGPLGPIVEVSFASNLTETPDYVGDPDQERVIRIGSGYLDDKWNFVLTGFEPSNDVLEAAQHDIQITQSVLGYVAENFPDEH